VTGVNSAALMFCPIHGAAHWRVFCGHLVANGQRHLAGARSAQQDPALGRSPNCVYSVYWHSGRSVV